MKNILNETPDGDLTGRFLASVNFVESGDIEGKEILDIGCGYGWCELNFLKRGAKHIIGAEVSEGDLLTIKKNITDERLSVAVASAIALPFPDESFDTVVSWEVIEHLPKGTEEKMFAEVHRVLKKGGVFYLSTPHQSFWATVLDPAWWLIGHRHYTKEHLGRYARKTSFTFEKVLIRGGWWNIFSILNMYFSKWLFRKWMLMSDMFVKKENAEYVSGKEGFTNIFSKFRKV